LKALPVARFIKVACYHLYSKEVAVFFFAIPEALMSIT
jgi:hypothetical protein